VTRGCLLIACVAACGGKSAPKTAEEPKISAKPTTRVPIEDESEQEPGVQMLNARGRMDPAVIETGLAPHTTELTDCYTTKLNKRRWLGGHVALHWDISKDGTVTAVKLSESDLGAWPIEKCLLEVARSAEFGKPIGGDADFMVPLEFSAKGRLAVWDEDQGLKAVGGQVAKLDSCEEPKPAPKHKPRTKPEKITVPDDVTITLYVGPRGQAQSVGFSSAKSVIEDAWADCAEKTALAWRLPDPKGQVAKLAVRYRAQ
jgi:hypothetical protein